MPMYNVLCPECGLDTEKLISFDEFKLHSDRECPVECPNCKQETAFYSLTHLKENLTYKSDNVMNFYSPSTQERWYRGMEGLGKS